MKRWIIALLIVVGMSITPTDWAEGAAPEGSDSVPASVKPPVHDRGQGGH